jgi:hypothetical protein
MLVLKVSKKMYSKRQHHTLLFNVWPIQLDLTVDAS